MNIHDYSSMFQPSPSPSSQIPLVIHHPSSWKTLPQPYHNHATGDYNHLPAPPFSPHPSHGGLLKRVVDGLQFHESQQGPDPSRIETEMNKMAAQEMVDAKALAASKSHSEAERRRRERINNHLTKLRSLLPNTTKTDKASLLAEVIQHVKDLKRQTSMIHEQSSVPSETDEFTIDNTSDEEGRIVIRASLCCEDRSDLLKDLMDTLKMLRLKTLKAEITTLGRRVKNVLFVTGDSSTCDNQQMANHSINIIEETLKALIEKTRDGDDSSLASIKRQRTNNVDRRNYC